VTRRISSTGQIGGRKAPRDLGQRYITFEQPPDPKIHKHGRRKQARPPEDMDNLNGRNNPAAGLDGVAQRRRRQPCDNFAQRDDSSASIVRRASGL